MGKKPKHKHQILYPVKKDGTTPTNIQFAILIWPQKAQNQNFRACNFNVLQWTKFELLTFYESINFQLSIPRWSGICAALQQARPGHVISTLKLSGKRIYWQPDFFLKLSEYQKRGILSILQLKEERQAAQSPAMYERLLFPTTSNQ